MNKNRKKYQNIIYVLISLDENILLKKESYSIFYFLTLYLAKHF